MIALLGGLALLMGLSLGLFGGGGSVLAVPILHYVAGLEPKSAIATSLLVVGATSAVCTAQHAKSGHVSVRTGLVFGGVAMVGAYGGGQLSRFFSGELLLALFAAMMIAAGVAMLRRRDPNRVPKQAPLWLIAIEGLVVGAATGLVGAGGGFLVVPALVLLGGLDMRTAIGTSALVIALKSVAGFLGYAAHVPVDYSVGAVVAGFAFVGSVIGAAFVSRVDPEKLRRAFGVFVLAVAAFMLYRQAPAPLREAVFVTRWPFWAGGAAIGLFVIAFLLGTRESLGVSSGFSDACALPFDPKARRSWRIPFMLGIVGGGALSAALGGGLTLTTTMGAFDTLVGASLPLKALVFTGGGVLVGFGARLAGGCTSGHGITGTAQLARSSIVATVGFMIAGFAVTHAALAALGAQ